MHELIPQVHTKYVLYSLHDKKSAQLMLFDSYYLNSIYPQIYYAQPRSMKRDT